MHAHTQCTRTRTDTHTRTHTHTHTHPHTHIQNTHTHAHTHTHTPLPASRKQVLKEERNLHARTYGYALVDGRIEKVGNVTVEPPSLFRGRGTHPKMGRLKARIQPEEVTINVAHTSAVPECPVPGHSWKQVVHR
jgi:DNA topoisomerase IB